MVKLTSEQEDIIEDNVYHEKKLEKEKKHKMFPVNPKQLDKILKKIGRRESKCLI